MTVRNYLKHTPIVLLYCLIGASGMTYFTCYSCRTSGSLYFQVAAFSFICWFVLWMGNGLIGEYLGQKVSWVDHPVRRLVLSIVTTMVFSTAMILFLLVSWEYILDFPFGDYVVIVSYSLAITFAICLILYSRDFLINWKQSAIDAEKFQKESIKAQYDSLRSQVNPHFLFNSLNALTNLVYQDPDRAAKFIKQLSDVYRYVLDTRQAEVVSLETELKFLKAYLYLQEIRYEENLRVELNVNGKEGSVAPLALQMLIENAIKHNIVSAEKPLLVKIFSEGGFIIVENNLQKKLSPDEEGSGIGLENIRMRYSFLSDKPVTVEAGDEKFIVKLPILEWKEE